MTDLPHSTAAERNKQPILDALRDLLGARGTALEIASGTGQHAVWFAAALADWVWQPTDADAGALPAIAARIAQSGLLNLRPPVLLDVMSTPWPDADAPFAERFDAIFCANMLHIAPPATCAALMQGAARHLQPDGVLITYGPYLEDGPVAPSNEATGACGRAIRPGASAGWTTWCGRRLARGSRCAHGGRCPPTTCCSLFSASSMRSRSQRRIRRNVDDAAAFTSASLACRRLASMMFGRLNSIQSARASTR